MNIIPGEPIPPGFEDEVNRVAEIQSIIENHRDNALVGTEYTVELIKDDEREPLYTCLLCEKRGDPRTILTHWVSYNHRLKYLEKHFPSVIRELAPIRYKPDSRSIMNRMVIGICDAIERHYGRLPVSVYHNDGFRSIHDRVVEEINNKYHYDEKNGPSFLDAIDRDFLEKNCQTLQITIKAPSRVNASATQGTRDRESLDSISSDDDGGQLRRNSGSSAQKKKRRSQSPAYKVLPRVRRSPPFEEARPSDTKKGANNATLPTPKELSMQAFQIAQERYKWEKYRCMLELAIKGLEKNLKGYEKNPEKHPLYPEEWIKFWNRRYKELQTEKKINPNKYDYKPEWIVFWTKRMKELHAEEIEQKKKEIKINLGLPEDAEEKTDMLKQKYKIQPSLQSTSSRPVKPASEPNPKSLGGKKEVAIVISDDEDDGKRPSKSRSSRRSPGRNHARTRTKSRSLSPLSDDYREPERARPYRNSYDHSKIPRSSRYSSRGPAEYYGPPYGGHFAPQSAYGSGYRVMEPYMYPQYDHMDTFPPTKGKSKMDDMKEEPEEEGPLTVVAVLRLLTALEEHLGSLGPKVVDLLGKALALEKVKANSSDEMLINEDNSVFFETIKEKLKGLLIADVLDDQQKVRAVKKAVKNIAAIIHQVNEKGAANTSETNAKGDENTKDEDKPKINSNSSKPSIADLPFDRQMVSTKLAAALVMQGREDVSTEDMDKLIYFFILLVKLSKERMSVDGKPLQIQQILSELGLAPQISPSIVEEIIGHEVSTLVAEVDMDIDMSDKEINAASSATALESLTDSDLQTLLQNFKHLSTEEQHHLIAHLKKLETADPVRVEKLRKYVNLEADAKNVSTTSTQGSNDSKYSSGPSRSKRSVGGESPPSMRKDPYTDDEASHSSIARKMIDDEDEDDDYNFEDVFKAASNNVTRNSEDRSLSSINRSQHTDTPDSISQQHFPMRQRTQPASENPSLPSSNSSVKLNDKSMISNMTAITDTQNLIANLMGSLQQSCGQFTNPSQPGKSTDMDDNSNRSRLMNPSHNGNMPLSAGRNPQPPAPPQTSVPFYQQQQQAQQQQMYANFQNPQGPSSFYPGNVPNTVAYPNTYYGGLQPGANHQQMPQFNMGNFMQQSSSNQANYSSFMGNSGYK